MDGDFKAYDEQGWPLCDFCPNRAISAEALLRTPTGNYPPVGRCRAHQRTTIATNHVSSAVTARMRRPIERTSKRPSQAVSAQYTADCPTCGAKGASLDEDPNTTTPRVAGQPCRSKTTGRVTDTHRARIEAQYAH